MYHTVATKTETSPLNELKANKVPIVEEGKVPILKKNEPGLPSRTDPYLENFRSIMIK